MDTFTLRDLREHTGALIRDAKEGKLSPVTKRGRPVFLAVPFTQTLLQYGVNVILAANLSQEGAISLAKAAKLANQTLQAFMEKLDFLGIPVVSYSADELEQELGNFE